MTKLHNSRLGDKAFDAGIYLITGLIALLCLYPLYLVLINSFSDPFAVARGEVVLLPKGFSFDAYIQAFKNGDIMRGYANSLFYLVFGVTLNMVLTIPAAYALSKQHMKGRNFIMMMIVFTMYFSGGLIPYFLLVNQLGMMDTIWVLTVPGAINVWNCIIYVAALSSVDPALHEAAEIDGASRIQRIIHINIPCILPTIAIMLIMKLGHIMSVGADKVLLMKNDLNADTAEVITTFVYNRGLLNGDYSYSAAVGLFVNVINLIMLLSVNKASKKLTETSLF